MATNTVLKSKSATLSGATVDTVNLQQWWDKIEVSNQGSTTISVSLDGTTPTALGDNFEVVEPGVTKLFPASRQGNGVPGSGSLYCHIVKIIGSSNPYTVTGVAGQ